MCSLASSIRVVQKLFHPLVSQCRYRGKVNIKHPRPVHMPRRIMEAVTQPIYEAQLDDPSKVCSILKYETQKNQSQAVSASQKNLYEAFLVREARKIFEANKMIVAFQSESMDARKKTAVANILHPKGFSLIFFPADILRKSIDGTKWHNMQILMHNPTALIVSEKPQAKELLAVIRKIPELILLGGVVEDCLLTREGLVRFSRLPSLNEQYGQLVNTLSIPAAATHQILSRQQTVLSHSLEQHSKHDVTAVHCNNCILRNSA